MASPIRRAVRRAQRIAAGEQTEDEQLAEVVAELRGRGHRPWHTPNESAAPVQYRVALRRKGLRPGVVDLLLFHPQRVLAAIEHKRKPGMEPTPDQQAFLDEAAAAGALTAVTGGIDELRAVLRKWGYL